MNLSITEGPDAATSLARSSAWMAMLQSALYQNEIQKNTIANQNTIALAVKDTTKYEADTEANQMQTDSYTALSSAITTFVGAGVGEMGRMFEGSNASALSKDLENGISFENALNAKTIDDARLGVNIAQRNASGNITGRKILSRDPSAFRNFNVQSDEGKDAIAYVKMNETTEQNGLKSSKEIRENLTAQRDVAINKQQAWIQRYQAFNQMAEQIAASVGNANKANQKTEQGEAQAQQQLANFVLNNNNKGTDTASQAMNAAVQAANAFSQLDHSIMEAAYSFRG